jgi:hypothetical protein
MKRIVLALLVVLVGCATTATPQRKAYATISDAVAGATAAMGVFNDRYQQGLQTEADRTKVLAGWKEFQSLVHAAEAIAKDPNRTSDPVALVSDGVANLVALIASLKTPSAALWVPVWSYA